MSKSIKKQVRYSEADAAYLEEEAKKHRMNFSEYIRQITLNHHEQRVDPQLQDAVEELVDQYRRIGININQIAHYCNANQGITKIEREEVAAYQKKLDRKMSQLLEAITGGAESGSYKTFKNRRR